MSDWTSIPLRKEVIEVFRKKAKASGMTQNKYLQNLMIGNPSPNQKAYIYNPEDYDTLTDIAEFLFATNLIKSPDAITATKFAIDNLITGINKSMQKPQEG